MWVSEENAMLKKIEVTECLCYKIFCAEAGNYFSENIEKDIKDTNRFLGGRGAGGLKLGYFFIMLRTPDPRKIETSFSEMGLTSVVTIIGDRKLARRLK